MSRRGRSEEEEEKMRRCCCGMLGVLVIAVVRPGQGRPVCGGWSRVETEANQNRVYAMVEPETHR